VITRPMIVLDLFVPDESEATAIIDPMEAFFIDCQIEFDRLMRTDPIFREFMSRQMPRLNRAARG
jgi:hypothetical protein